MTPGNPANGSASALPLAPAAHRQSSLTSSGSGAVVAASPLTHHEILRMVEPFTRRGRAIDLAACDRLERRLVFKPVVHDPTSECTGITEMLRLENPRTEVFRLVRTLTPTGGAAAVLVAEGRDPGDLLARIETVPPQRPFETVGDVVIARSYRIDATSGSQPVLVLTAADTRLNGLTLTLNAETGKGYPAEIELLPHEDGARDLPDDLLATLGWDWRVIRRRGSGWTSTLRVPRREPARSRRIELLLTETVAHLSRTLAEPPRAFHERLTRARWGVVFRRLIPLLLCAALIAGTFALSFADIPQDSMLLMMIFNFPPLLMIAVFGMRELPRFEIPPLPQRSTAPSWLAREAATIPDRRP